jgi:type II secretory pathway pseudopilin PulG
LTLIEVLVVVAIVGLLVALLVPAVQSARESTRRVACGDKLRQRSLAIEQFNAANGHYPAGAINLEWNSPRVNMWIQTLPYVEQSSLFGQLDLKFGGGFRGGGNEGAKRKGRSSHARIGQTAYCSPGEEMRSFPFRGPWIFITTL